MSMTPGNRRPVNLSIHVAFWLMAAMLLLNVVWIPTLIGLGRAVSWLVALPLLLSQMFLVSLAFRLPLRRAMGSAGFLIVAALAYYFFIGSSMAIGTVPYPFESMLKIIYSAMAVVAAAVGSSLVLRQTGIDGLVTGMLALLGVTCTLIIASPLLRNVFSFQHQDFFDQFFGVFMDPNDAGYMGCLAAVLALASLTPHSRCRKLAAAVLMLSVVATILTNSRSAIVTLGLTLFFFLPSLYRALRAFWPAIVGVVIGMTLLVANVLDFASLFSEKNIRRFTQMTQPFEANVLEDSRLFLWRIALPQIAEAPVLGGGLGKMQYLDGTICGGSIYAVCGVHNTYLLLLGEAGMVALTLFLLFLATLLWQRWRWGASIATNVAAGWTLVLAVNAMMFHHLLSTLWCGFVIGVSCAMAAYAAETVSAPTKVDLMQPSPRGGTGLSTPGGHT